MFQSHGQDLLAQCPFEQGWGDLIPFGVCRFSMGSSQIDKCLCHFSANVRENLCSIYRSLIGKHLQSAIACKKANKYQIAPLSAWLTCALVSLVSLFSKGHKSISCVNFGDKLINFGDRLIDFPTTNLSILAMNLSRTYQFW